MANICLYAWSMSIGEGEAASELLLAVESYRSRPAVELSGAQIGEELVRLRHVVDLLEVEFAKLSGRFAETDEWDGGGFFSPIHWIRVNCHLGGGAAADRITVGEQLEALPLSSAALEEGGIGFSHLALLAGTAAAVVDGHRPLDEGRLLGKGLELTVSQFRKACQHERHTADPGGFAEDERVAAEERKLTLSTFEDGGLFLKGVFDPAGGAAIRNALEPLARKCGKDDWRPREQRLADALVELAGHALDSGVIPHRGSQRPHLQVTTSLETLLSRIGAPAADLEFSLPISSKVVERLACDCNVTRILLDADSTVIDVGRSKAAGQWSESQGAQRPRPALPLARLRPAGELEPGPPPQALDRWRPIRPGELGAALPSPPLDGPRRPLADRQTGGRQLPHHPSSLPRRPMGQSARPYVGRLDRDAHVNEPVAARRITR